MELVEWLRVGHGLIVKKGGKLLIRIASIGVFGLLPAVGEEATTGDLLWTFDPGGVASNQSFYTEPAIGPDGTIYVGYVPSKFASSGTFYALNPDGSVKWNDVFAFTAYAAHAGDKATFQTPSVGDDGTVYLSCSGSQYAYAPEGVRKWKKSYTVNDPRDLTASLAPVAISGKGRIYLPQGDNALMELDPEDGDALWSFKSTAEHRFSFARYAVINAEGSLFFSAWSNNLYKISGDGDLLFRYNSGGKNFPSGGNPSALSASGRVISPQGRSYEDQYLAVREAGGGIFPRFLTDYPGVSVSPVIDHEQALVFADREGHLTKLDENLNQVWSLDGYADQSAVLCADGTIYAVSNDFKNPVIRNLDASGQTVFEIAGEMPHPGATKPNYPEGHSVVLPLVNLTLSRTGELYAASRNGKFYAFQAAAPLSTSDWPKAYGGYANASRLTGSAPEIVSQPGDLEVISGSSQALSIGSIGRPLPSVQWFHDGEVISGAIGKVLHVGHQGSDEAGEYYAILTNDSGSVQSDTVTVTVQHHLNLTAQIGGSVNALPEMNVYEHLSPVTVTAVPAPGFVFAGWSGSVASEDNPLSIEMDYSKSLNARFTDVESPGLVMNETFPAVTKVPEFTVTGSVSDNDRISQVRYVLNGNSPSYLSFLDLNFSFTVPLQFGENSLSLTVRDHSGLETMETHIITWEPEHYWAAEGPESAGEAKEISTEIYLGSPGDVAGANITVTSNPALLTYLRFQPAKAILQTFQTLSEENGVINLTFASLNYTIPAGKTHIGTVFYRVRSLPQPIEHVFTLQQIDLAGSDGSPIKETSGIHNATVNLQPREIIGDVNNNGRFDVGDAQQLQRLLGGLDDIRPWDSGLNDANGSGGLDIGDIIVVLQTAVGILPQPGGAERRSRSRTVPVAYDPDAPRARIILDPPFAEAGATVTARVVLDSISSEFGGAEFTLKYPVDALRLLDGNSHQVGEIQPDSSLYLWNVGPSQNDYENQDGTISFAAGSAENWAGSEAGGVIAEFVFTVQEGASSQAVWELDLKESDLSFDDGLTVLSCRTEPAQFIGQPLTWASWLLNSFTLEELGDPLISGKLADADQDGHTNEFEYFLGTDPRLADGGEAVKAIWVETGEGQVFFGLEVAYDVRVTDFVAALEWSEDLLSWNAEDAAGSPDWWTRVYPKGKSEFGKLMLMDLRGPSGVAPAFLRLKLD